MNVGTQLLLETGVFDLTSHRVRKEIRNKTEARYTRMNYTEKKERRYIMKTFNKMTLLSAALAAFLLPATAQTSSSSPDASSTPTTSTAPTTTSTSPSGGQNSPETGKRIN